MVEITDAAKFDVLVVGAGPSGLVCANALARSGVRVKIIDHKLKRGPGQADSIMPRTMEIIQSYGLGDDFMKQANAAYTTAFYRAREDGTGIENTNYVPAIGETETRWPYAFTLHQGAVEALFIQSMSKEGVSVDRPVRPVSMQVSRDPVVLQDRDAYPITVRLERLDTGDAPYTIQAKFVLGGDGAHSWIRQQLGITMVGETTPQIWGAIDFKPAQVPSIFPDWRHAATIVAEDHTILMLPREEEKIRLYLELGEITSPGGGNFGTRSISRLVNQAKRIGPEELIAFATKAFKPFSIAPVDLSDVEWSANYMIGQRVASKFSVGDRAFIAGDACHTHSPKGGQGMNVSMNDTHNLAWKLVYFLKGWADYSILGTYELERRPVAEALIEFDKWYAAGFSSKARAEHSKATGGQAPEPWEGFRNTNDLTSGVGITYNPSILVSSMPSSDNSPATHLILGRCLPPCVVIRAADSRPTHLQDKCPSDGRFKVLVFAGDITDPAQAECVDTAAKGLAGPTGLLRSYKADFEVAFEILPIVKGSEKKTLYTHVPSELWLHWSNVFVDEPSIHDPKAGTCYEMLGISPTKGAIVIVRPDGHVGSVAQLDAIRDVEAYFDGFLLR